jgi:hypothetical protein
MFALRMLGLAVVMVLLAGCMVGVRQLTGSGETVTNSYDFADFTRIEAGHAFELDIRQGDSYSVEVTVDDNIEQYLDVTQNGDTVRLQLKPRLGFGLSNATLRASVTLPTLEGLDLSGATRATISGFESQELLDVQASGASTLRGDITSGDARFDISGASTVTLDGAGGNLDLEVSGASTANLEDYAVTDARVNASGASRATVNVSGELQAEASGASGVRFTGDPSNVRSNTSGASSVEPR